MTGRRYAIVSPCRDEAEYMHQTLESVAAQSEPPALWVVVDDGSTDRTPQILAEFAAAHPYVQVLTLPPRSSRVLGPAVVHAFDAGLATVDLDDFDYVVKLDMDLDLPPGYFAGLMDRMALDPRLASASGTACQRRDGVLVPERGSFEITVGMSKFYRVSAFRDIGGFVPVLMWDGSTVTRRGSRAGAPEPSRTRSCASPTCGRWGPAIAACCAGNAATAAGSTSWAATPSSSRRASSPASVMNRR